MDRYSEYKPSSIQWLRELPSHWEEKRLVVICEPKNVTNCSDEQLLSVFLGKGVVPFNSENTRRTNAITKNTDLTKYQLVEPGDFVLNNQQAWRGSVGVSFWRGIVSPAYIVLRFKKSNNAKYLDYALQSRYMIGQFFIYSKGIGSIQKNISWKDFKSSLFLCPPLAEQKKIVSYLNNKISKIDEFLLAKEGQIRLLQELKESEIANVITRGLNPHVKMKDSRIPWLKTIPEHWYEERAKYLFNRESRSVSETDDIITCFRDGQVTLRKNRRTTGFTESLKECGYQGIRKGDLVIHQMDAFAGAVGISDSDGKGTPVYIVCTPKRSNVYNPYFAMVIRAMGLNGYIQSLYRGIRERSSDFKFDVFRQQYLPLPPIEEQKAIVTLIQERSNKVRSLINELQAEIEYLKEYKQSLIADCVTGQINVQQ